MRRTEQICMHDIVKCHHAVSSLLAILAEHRDCDLASCSCIQANHGSRVAQLRFRIARGDYGNTEIGRRPAVARHKVGGVEKKSIVGETTSGAIDGGFRKHQLKLTSLERAPYIEFC